MTAACLDCGSTFQARGDWQTRCWACWRDHKAATDADDAWDRGWRKGFRDGRDAHRDLAGHAAAPLDEALIRDLVALTHPDRHPAERAEQATRATAALLDLLANARQRKAVA